MPSPCLTENDARAVLLLWAVEAPLAGAPAVAWNAADAAWASDQARRHLGESATMQDFLVARARLALARLVERGVVGPDTVPLPGGLWRRLAQVLLPTSLVLGLAADALGGAQRINLLAPPLLGLMGWNLAVYAVLAWQALRQGAAGLGAGRTGAVAEPGEGAEPGRLATASPGGLASWLAARLQAWWPRLLHRAQAALPDGQPAAYDTSNPSGALGPSSPSSPSGQATALNPQARARAVADLWQATAGLQGRRAAALLHTAAALLALGLLLGLYARGLVLDYRAGWDSTFLDAHQVRSLLGTVLGPAASFTGWALPDAATLEALRWSRGSSGDPAARWIHLQALTVAAVVLLPRGLLAGWQWMRSKADAQQVPLPLQGGYFQALRLEAPARAQPVNVLPYSFALDDAQRAALPNALALHLGAGAQPALSPSLPMGAEDDLPRYLPAALADTVVALFALSATPERETHGAFVRALAAALPDRCTLRVMVDESGYRARLGGDVGGAVGVDQRLDQRRQAWQRLLADLGLPAPVFIRLSSEVAA